MGNKYVPFTITHDISGESGAVDVQARISKVNSVLKSLSDDGLGVLSSKITKTDKELKQLVYVIDSLADAARRSFNALSNKNVGGELVPTGLSAQAGEPVGVTTVQRRIVADKRKRDAIAAQVAGYGGTMSPSDRQDYYNVTLPDVEVPGASGRMMPVQNVVRSKIYSANRPVLERQKAETLAKEAAEAEKERKAKEREAEKKKADSEREDNLFRIHMVAAVYMAVKVLQGIFDIATKIFHAVSNLASQSLKTSVAGMTLGISPVDLMMRERSAVTKGLDSGTYTSALKGLQGKFSNITRMDRGALESLAVVMGGDVEELVMSGMGGEDPAALLDLIIGKFMERAMSGKNELGHNVGVDKATRGLSSYLEKVDPSIAQIFNQQMWHALNNNDPLRRQDALGTTSAWLDANRSSVNPAGITGNDTKFLASYGEGWRELAEILNGLKEGVLLQIALNTQGLVEMLRNMARTFMSADMKEQDVLRARESNALKADEARRALVGVEHHKRRTAEGLLARGRTPGSGYHRYIGTEDEQLAALYSDVDNLSKGIIPENLRGLNPEQLSQYMDLAILSRQSSSLGSFIGALDKERGSRDTKWVSGDATSILDMAHHGTTLPSREVLDRRKQTMKSILSTAGIISSAVGGPSAGVFSLVGHAGSLATGLAFDAAHKEQYAEYERLEGTGDTPYSTQAHILRGARSMNMQAAKSENALIQAIENNRKALVEGQVAVDVTIKNTEGRTLGETAVVAPIVSAGEAANAITQSQNVPVRQQATRNNMPANIPGGPRR